MDTFESLSNDYSVQEDFMQYNNILFVIEMLVGTSCSEDGRGGFMMLCMNQVSHDT